MMFSASRSRRLQIVPIIQSFSQLEKNYGKEGAEIIVDNTQLTIFGGFAPQSTSAETLSKALGSRTVMSGSVSRSKNDPSESLQMIERPLMTPDELKSMPKGQFVVMKTGFYPMKVKLKLFFKWGIHFDEDHPYTVSDQGNRKVAYASKKDITDGIIKKYHPELLEPAASPDDETPSGGQNQQMTEHHQPASIKKNDEKDKNGGTALQTVPKNRRTPLPQPPKNTEVTSDGRLNFLYKMDLPHRAKLVYIYLHDRMDKEKKAWPGLNTIAKDLSLSRSTVKRAIKDLEKVGLIRKEPHYRENGSATSNRYYLL